MTVIDLKTEIRRRAAIQAAITDRCGATTKELLDLRPSVPSWSRVPFLQPTPS